MNLFELENVSYSYLGKFPAVSSVSLEIGAGERTALLGANGSGKSTLLRLLDGLIFPDRGSVRAFDEPLTEETLQGEFRRFFRRQVGLVFQSADTQLFCPSVADEIAFGPLQMGLAPGEVEARVEDSLNLLRISHLRGRGSHELSLGEKKKVAIAAVLSVNPEVLLLDEPTAGLDPRSIRELIDLIEEAYSRGKTVVTATHDLHLLAEIADTAHVLGEDKTLVTSGPVDEILADMELLETHNLLHSHRHKHPEGWHRHRHEHSGAHEHEHEEAAERTREIGGEDSERQ